jgi:hypothetical protein
MTMTSTKRLCLTLSKESAGFGGVELAIDRFSRQREIVPAIDQAVAPR